ncbi:hypothetical protein RFI_07740 [Reticulomyxa filosa]|uniref:ubiquitinyl hydrolase 1 n=1 Tax=Reticulomyxa filosa TaxID=46433 RepID=X6NSZ3_RETFI|nr:hypothetical protein RFI_07740 [Reticulomyxa filosa]|eukprot:ETO29380.1 hypothetical protein RFI_07740 [Reticulomyxa filosa]
MSQSDLGNAQDLYVLKGIGPNQDIGFLTSLETMGYMKVGEHYKTPKFPIWVIGSSTHYSVLFALDEQVGKLSAQDTEMVSVKRAFTAYDQLEHGFIQFRDLPFLLQDLKIDKSSFEISDCKAVLDPDNTQIIVWSRFWHFFQLLKQPDKIQWQCNICTFLNPLKHTTCGVCSTVKEKNNAILFDDSQVNVLCSLNFLNSTSNTNVSKNFILYHFNGLQHTEKDKPSLTKICVFDGMNAEIVSPDFVEDLTGIIRTKWPSALIHYPESLHSKYFILLFKRIAKNSFKLYCVIHDHVLHTKKKKRPQTSLKAIGKKKEKLLNSMKLNEFLNEFLYLKLLLFFYKHYW